MAPLVCKSLTAPAGRIPSQRKPRSLNILAAHQPARQPGGLPPPSAPPLPPELRTSERVKYPEVLVI